jgi:hypothetical protein
VCVYNIGVLVLASVFTPAVKRETLQCAAPATVRKRALSTMLAHGAPASPDTGHDRWKLPRHARGAPLNQACGDAGLVLIARLVRGIFRWTHS